MPHLTVQCGPGGAILDAWIGVSAARRAALTAATQPVPAMIHVRALVDTGASHTCVASSVLHPLGITPTGTVPIFTPSTGVVAADREQYDISLLILNDTLPPFLRATMPAICTELFGGIDVLIGRDILNTCLLVFDGNTCSLAY